VNGDVAGAIQQQLSGLIGEETARTMMEVRQQQRSEGGFLSGLIGIGLLLLGASGVFGQLQDAMNTIWEVKPKANRGVLGMIKDRFLSFTMVLGVTFLLLVSLIRNGRGRSCQRMASWWLCCRTSPGTQFVVYRRHLVVRDDFQIPAGCEDRLERRVDRCGRHRRAVCDHWTGRPFDDGYS